MADTMSQKVVGWAHSKLRQRVGRGECWDLADQALRASGARTSKTTGPDDNYDWGTPVRIEQVVRGDILQFRNWNVKTTTETTVRFTDGSGYHNTNEGIARRPHHTGIVEHVGG